MALRTITLMVIGMVLAASVIAQTMEEVIYLKNGSIIRGTIIEQVPGRQ